MYLFTRLLVALIPQVIASVFNFYVYNLFFSHNALTQMYA